MQRHTLTKVREINGNFFLFYPLISTVKVLKNEGVCKKKRSDFGSLR